MPSVCGIQGFLYGLQIGVIWRTNPPLYGVQQAISVFMWSYGWVFVCHTRGVCMPYSPQPPSVPNLGLPKSHGLAPWRALARERGTEDSHRGRSWTVSPFNVALWYANDKTLPKKQPVAKHKPIIVLVCIYVWFVGTPCHVQKDCLVWNQV